MDGHYVLPSIDGMDDDDSSFGQPHATAEVGDEPIFVKDVLNDHVYATGVAPLTPAIRNSGNVDWVEAYDALRWHVPERSDDLTWPKFQANGTVKLGETLADEKDFTVGPTSFTYKGNDYPLTDYKGRAILVPDYRMWGWYAQRRVTRLTLDDTDADLGFQDRVVFGTSADNYTDYPEKWGFKSRKTVRNLTSWQNKQAGYEARLATLNPTRHQTGLKGMRKRWNGDLAPAGRWDEIHEESGLRIKHAPCILMKNQFITTYENFVGSYLDGARGAARHGVSFSTSAFVTNHEIYRMFSGKYRKRILDNTLFADGNLVVVKPVKQHFTGNPLKAMFSDLKYKNQVSRWYRINFKSL